MKSPAFATHTPEPTAAEFNRRGLFVGGSPKSGTTLLLALLDGHPELVVLPEETHFLEHRRKDRARGDATARLHRMLAHPAMQMLQPQKCAPPREALGHDARDYLDFDYSQFVQRAEHFARQPGMNDSLLLSETIRAYAITMGYPWQDCVRWVEKTPSNVACSDELFRLFPEARLIQMVRDPRAVYASRRRRLTLRYGSHTKAHRLVREWNQCSRQIARHQTDPQRYLLVRYEDLVRRSQPVLEQICAFAGIRFHSSLLQPTRGGRPWQGNSTFYEAFAGIDAHPVDHWQQDLTPDEIWWIELHCRAGMALAGYELFTDADFSFPRWAKRLPGESWMGYLRARRGSLSQRAGLLTDCRYDVPTPPAFAQRKLQADPAATEAG